MDNLSREVYEISEDGLKIKIMIPPEPSWTSDENAGVFQGNKMLIWRNNPLTERQLSQFIGKKNKIKNIMNECFLLLQNHPEKNNFNRMFGSNWLIDYGKKVCETLQQEWNNKSHDKLVSSVTNVMKYLHDMRESPSLSSGSSSNSPVVLRTTPHLTEIEPPQLVSSFNEAKKQRKEGGLRTRIPREIIRRIKKVDSDKVFEEVLSITKSIYDRIQENKTPAKSKPFINVYTIAKLKYDNKNITKNNFEKYKNNGISYFKQLQEDYIINNPDKIKKVGLNTVIELNDLKSKIAFKYEEPVSFNKNNFNSPINTGIDGTEYLILAPNGKKLFSRRNINNIGKVKRRLNF